VVEPVGLPTKPARPALPADRAVLGAGLAAVAAAAVPVVRSLVGQLASAADLPQWDMAKYGVSGLRLADAARRLAPFGWLAEVNAHDVWPPLFPLAESAAFLAFGPGFRVPELLVAGLFAAAAAAAFAAGWQVERDAGAGRAALAGVLVAALWLASPFSQLYATLTMLEVPGALGLFAAAALYARWLRLRRLADLRRAALAATLLFFVKYNYGLLWMVPMLAHEAWDEVGTLRALGRRWRAAAAGGAWRRPWPLFLLLYALAVASIPLSGGWRFTLAGAEVRATSVGNPLYALYLLVLLRLALWPAARRRALARWRALPERGRVLGRWIGLPVALWMLPPGHLKGFFTFVENRASDLTLAAHVATYPRSFLAAYHAAEPLAWAVAAAALVPLLRLPRLAAPRRAIGLALVTGLAAALLHPYKEPRFLFTVVPLAWIAAAGGVAEAVDRLAWKLPARWRPWPRAAVALAALALVVAAGVDGDGLRRERALRSVEPSARPLLDAVAAEAEAAAAAGAAPVLVGYWNDLSPALAEWRLRQRAPSATAGAPAVPLAPGDLAAGGDPEAVLARAAAEGRRILVVEALGRRAEDYRIFVAETAALAPLRAAAAADDRFTGRGHHRFGAAGWRLRVYRPAEPRPVYRRQTDPVH